MRVLLAHSLMNVWFAIKNKRFTVRFQTCVDSNFYVFNRMRKFWLFDCHAKGNPWHRLKKITFFLISGRFAQRWCTRFEIRNRLELSFHPTHVFLKQAMKNPTESRSPHAPGENRWTLFLSSSLNDDLRWPSAPNLGTASTSLREGNVLKAQATISSFSTRVRVHVL